MWPKGPKYKQKIHQNSNSHHPGICFRKLAPNFVQILVLITFANPLQKTTKNRSLKNALSPTEKRAAMLNPQASVIMVQWIFLVLFSNRWYLVLGLYHAVEGN